MISASRIASDNRYRDEVRHRCITDHFFLAELLGFDKFIREVHQPAVDLYFPKNPHLKIEEQHQVKNRLHIDPRSSFKTTLGRVDSLQWILAFPETITILNETATQPLASAITTGTAQFFCQPKGKVASLLQMCFPELVVCKVPAGAWSTPVHDPKEIDETLDFTSPGSTQSGWHPWVLNPDDMVDTKNSGLRAKPEIREGVIQTHNVNRNLLRPGGYVNMRGTRYHPEDLYGNTLDTMDPEQWRVLIRGAVTVRNGERLMPGEFPAEADLICNFPGIPGMDYRSLRTKFYEDYEAFMSQQQNDPCGGFIPLFDERLYSTMLIPFERIPVMGDAYICWRLPYGGKDYMQAAEGAAVRLWADKLYVVDAWSTTATPSHLAEKIVRESKRLQTDTLLLEYLPGVQYMEQAIRNEALRRNMSLRIQWLDFEDDDNIRRERIRQLEPQAKAGRIHISTAIARAADLRRQFLNFGLIRENGMIDAISRLAAKVPTSLLRSEIEAEETDRQIARRNQIIAQFVHGYGGVSALEEQRIKELEAQQAAMAKIDTLGLTDILGGLDG